MHSRWNAMLMAMVDGKVIEYSSLMLQKNVLKNVADVIPHCVKIVHIMPPCDKDVMLSNYIIYAPTSPVHLRVTCPWLLILHLLLDVYHTRLSQDL